MLKIMSCEFLVAICGGKQIAWPEIAAAATAAVKEIQKIHQNADGK